MWRAVLLLLLPCASLLSSAGRAQPADLGVARGDWVRVVSDSGLRGEFFVDSIRRDTLVLRSKKHYGNIVLPVDSIRTLKIGRQAHPAVRAVAVVGGALIGLTVGAVCGAEWGKGYEDDPPITPCPVDAWFCIDLSHISHPRTAEEKAQESKETGRVLGAVLGGLAGYAALEGHRWKRVDLHRQVGFFRRADGALGLTYAYRF